MAASYTTTTRNALRKITGGSKVSDLDEGIGALADDVDTKMASYSQDTFAKRPAAGQPNRIFKATDTGALYHDTGAAWEHLIVSAEGTHAERPAAGNAGRFYRETDTGLLFRDTGAVWEPMLRGASGAATLTFTSSASSAVLEIAHGLPAAPTSAFAISRQVIAGVVVVTPIVTGLDATNIKVQGWATSSVGATCTIYWQALL